MSRTKKNDLSHQLFRTSDKDAPDNIRDANGEVVLGLCKICGKAEIELEEPCEQLSFDMHPDERAVLQFSLLMRDKMNYARQVLKRSCWQTMTQEELSVMLHRCVAKGDPVDVANLCMMLELNGFKINNRCDSPFRDLQRYASTGATMVLEESNDGDYVLFADVSNMKIFWEQQAKQATSVIAMIRAMIGEMFGTVANLESDGAALLRGPESYHDGEAILAALQNIQAAMVPCAVEVEKLEWDGFVGFAGSFSYVVAPPSFTKGWRVWGKISDKSASIGGVLITTTAANEEEAKTAAQADFERRILSCVVTKTVDVAAVRKQAFEEAAKVAEATWPNGGPMDIGHGSRIATAIRAISAEPAPGEQRQTTHRHVKRGTEYQLIGIGKVQAEDWYTSKNENTRTIDMREVVIYRSVDDGSLWVRPREEFDDGRFITLPGAPTTEAGK